MSDADRLRVAADRLDEWADGQFESDYVSGQRVTAALLRAVADEAEACWCDPEYTERGLTRPGCPAHDVMIASLAAALALADVILGNADE